MQKSVLLMIAKMFLTIFIHGDKFKKDNIKISK